MGEFFQWEGSYSFVFIYILFFLHYNGLLAYEVQVSCFPFSRLYVFLSLSPSSCLVCAGSCMFRVRVLHNHLKYVSCEFHQFMGRYSFSQAASDTAAALFYRGCSWVMARPADRGRKCLKNPRTESSQVRRCWKSHGSTWVRSGVFLMLRVGPDHPDTIPPSRRDPTRERPWNCLAD